MPEKLLNINEVADLLGISVDEVKRLVEVGEIPAYKIAGTFLRFRKEQIDAIKREVYDFERSGSHPEGGKAARPNDPYSGAYTEFDYTFAEKIKDFVYFYDFYIISLLAIGVLLFIIFTR